MVNYEIRLARLEQESDPSFVVIVRRNGETDETAWRRYCLETGLPPRPARGARAFFISEVDALA